MLRLRKDGFTSVTAPYGPNTAVEQLPALLTRTILVPTGCPPGHISQNKTSCAYSYPNSTCPASAPPVTCKTDADCTAVMPSDPKLTCRGVPVTCLSGVCGSKLGGDLCVGKEYTGGVTLGLNVETSVAGFALVEVQQVSPFLANPCLPQPCSDEPSTALLQHGVNVSGMSLSDAVPIRGSALSAAPSWKSGASLTTLAGTEITLKIALTDARLFAVRIGCSSQ